MSEEFDLTKFEIRDELEVPGRTTRLTPRRHRTAPFLCGPVPMAWLRAAYQLPGQALPVAIELWHEAGLKKTRSIALSLSRMERHGVSRWAAGRGLAALEHAGLVAVVRHPGRKPVVTLLDVDQAGDVGDQQ